MSTQVTSTPLTISSGFSKDVPWYTTELSNISPQSRELLEIYSGVPAEQLESHILEIRDRAWSTYNYPCLGTFRFLDLGISLHPLYPTIVKRLQGGETLLDLGCCFAQDVRKLVFDGAPGENIWGADLHHDFIELGYELFRDRGKLKAHFLSGDVLDPESELKTLDGKIDIIFAGSFFHLFDFDAQVLIAKRMVKLLKPKTKSLVVGRLGGSVTPGDDITFSSHPMYRHDVESFERMWKLVGKETGTEWVVKGELGSPFGSWRKEMDADTNPRRIMTFEVHRA